VENDKNVKYTLQAIMNLNGYLLVSLDYILSMATVSLVIDLFRHRRILKIKPHALKSLPERDRCLV
jgi:hypothetical protein